MNDSAPIPMLLWCPSCGERHIDAGEFVAKPHRTHVCQHCGLVWRPALVATVGVRFLPGFKDAHETVLHTLPEPESARAEEARRLHDVDYARQLAKVLNDLVHEYRATAVQLGETNDVIEAEIFEDVAKRIDEIRRGLDGVY